MLFRSSAAARVSYLNGGAPAVIEEYKQLGSGGVTTFTHPDRYLAGQAAALHYATIDRMRSPIINGPRLTPQGIQYEVKHYGLD